MGPRLEGPAERPREKPKRVKDPASLLSLLEATEVSLKIFDKATKAKFLQRWPQLEE